MIIVAYLDRDPTDDDRDKIRLFRFGDLWEEAEKFAERINAAEEGGAGWGRPGGYAYALDTKDDFGWSDPAELTEWLDEGEEEDA